MLYCSQREQGEQQVGNMYSTTVSYSITAVQCGDCDLVTDRSEGSCICADPDSTGLLHSLFAYVYPFIRLAL